VITIVPATDADAGEVLTVQRAAYVSEAQLYDNVMFTALTETLDEVRAATAAGGVLVARCPSPGGGNRIVGAVRGELVDGECHVGRLVVAPDMRGRGIGRALLAAIEAEFLGRARSFVLFTGDRSVGNLRLYERAGYVRSRVEPVGDMLSLVYLEKTVYPERRRSARPARTRADRAELGTAS
jgi:GNAT superfamily N-acetyltransferase